MQILDHRETLSRNWVRRWADGLPAGSPSAGTLLLFTSGVGVLTALHLRFMAGLVVAASIFLLVAGASLIMLTGAQLFRSLLRSRLRMLSALHLGFMAGLIVTACVLFFCHITSPFWLEPGLTCWYGLMMRFVYLRHFASGN